jgi:hypothetical protein
MKDTIMYVKSLTETRAPDRGFVISNIKSECLEEINKLAGYRKCSAIMQN